MGLWDKTFPNHKAQLIALATHLKEKIDSEKSTRRKKPSKPKPAANQSGAGNLGKWLFEAEWCPLHGRETDGVHRGMYMSMPHDHEE